MDFNQISLVKVKNENIEQAVYQALELINAASLFSKNNMKIIIKPNILMSKEPERAVTTHPEVVRAVIKWIKLNNHKDIIVAESSGTSSPGATERAFEGSGIKMVCEEENVKWTSFEKTERKEYVIKKPLVFEKFISSPLIEEADLIINIPKIKTHWQCLLTCCIKNMFGTLLLGNKAKTHARFSTQDMFSSALADIYSVSNPQLTVIDGYLCQEGKGPSKGDVVKLDLIMAGYDPVALDSTVCKVIGLNPNDVKYIKKAEEKDLGTSDLSNIQFLGESLSAVSKTFKIPRRRPISVPLPSWLADYMGNVVFRATVKFDPKKCKLCSTCWENCPGDAITPPEIIKKENTPIWNKNKCIFCYCCAELCPYEAVNFKINYVKNIVFSWPGLCFLIIFGTIIGILLWIFL
ncbi:MAG: hypothetical protein BAJALOKI1v1_270029 [Promethearchaeota archaeon]|nr:MAG: hypothetical protein BAJALOKI1v1_270029 [Candidatus Lokiarchaeota archaeon]